MTYSQILGKLTVISNLIASLELRMSIMQGNMSVPYVMSYDLVIKFAFHFVL